MVGRWRGGLLKLPGGLNWKRDGFKYLGVFLGNENVTGKNWQGVLEKIQGKLRKWRWVLPQLTFRGETLIIHILVACHLWHRVTCVQPPRTLITEIQRELIDFLGGGNFHWLRKEIIFLPKEEGGHGVVDIKSRVATFRLQFLQKFLTGYQNV